MEAEEIIQQKEWFELSAAEQAQLKDLVTDEQEFNLLKQLLQVAAENVDRVPVVSPMVHEQLVAELQKVKPGRNHRTLYYAAAAIFVVLFATWLLNRTGNSIAPNEKDNIAVGIPKKENSVSLPAARKDSIKMNNEITATSNKNKITSPFTNSNKSSQKSITQPSVNNPVVANKINTALSNDSNLMAMITEVY